MARKKIKNVPNKATFRKQTKDVRTPSINIDSKPSWRFSTVDKAGPFSWPIGTTEELNIVSKLHNFDSMEWAKIEGKNHHFINVSDLEKPARDRLCEIGQDDVDQVFSFRLQGEQRIFCLRDRHIAKLLWFDPKHKVCLSKKKHT